MWIIRGTMFLLLLLGFWIFFDRLIILSRLTELFEMTRLGMDAASRQRNLAERQNLLELQRKHSNWYRIEQLLSYCGIRQRFPGMYLEKWVLMHIVLYSLVMLLTAYLFHPWISVVTGIALLVTEFIGLNLLKWRNYVKTEDNLTKLLDFLGNYSLSAGEITSVLGQISRYMEEPIKGALDSCYYEATTTGDTAKALLVMAERMEHPKFKELVRNMEISQRYCADFSLLVESSRRSLREYMRYTKERRGMLREAGIGLGLLIGMSLIALTLVGKLIGGFGIP